jgi:hypothetical protein
MQLLPREGGERVRESQLHFQIKVREEPLLFFTFFFYFFFAAYFIACARVASALAVCEENFFFFGILRVARVAADLPANKLIKP